MSSDSTTATNLSGPSSSLDWAEVIEVAPDPTVVTDAALRDAIVKTGLPWRVRDKGTEIEMVLIPPGQFMMGKSLGDDEASVNELPAHKVKLTKAFYLGRYEVTQHQYAKVMGNDPSNCSEKYISAAGDTAVDAAMAAGMTRKEAEQAAKELGVRILAKPVEAVSWNDCDAFCQKTKLRLPTEAEWEYACRAGQRTPRYGKLDEIAWYMDETAWIGEMGESLVAQSQAVGTKKANGFGLYDMLGNVEEWVNDREGGYSAYAQTNPQGPSSGSRRVLRGGSWSDHADSVRSSYRKSEWENCSDSGIGFRVSRTPFGSVAHENFRLPYQFCLALCIPMLLLQMRIWGGGLSGAEQFSPTAPANIFTFAAMSTTLFFLGVSARNERTVTAALILFAIAIAVTGLRTPDWSAEVQQLIRDDPEKALDIQLAHIDDVPGRWMMAFRFGLTSLVWALLPSSAFKAIAIWFRSLYLNDQLAQVAKTAGLKAAGFIAGAAAYTVTVVLTLYIIGERSVEQQMNALSAFLDEEVEVGVISLLSVLALHFLAFCAAGSVYWRVRWGTWVPS